MQNGHFGGVNHGQQRQPWTFKEIITQLIMINTVELGLNRNQNISAEIRNLPGSRFRFWFLFKQF